MISERILYQRVQASDSKTSIVDDYEFCREYYSGDRTRSCRRFVTRYRGMFVVFLLICLGIIFIVKAAQRIDGPRFNVEVSTTDSPSTTIDGNSKASFKYQAFLGMKTLGGKFKCDLEVMKPSADPPSDANKVKPADIRVIGALGDSISVGFLSKNSPIGDNALYYENSLFTGSDESLEKHITVANVLKAFNPELIGTSSSEENKGFNVAVSGRTSEDLPRQAMDMVQRMKQANVTAEWKLITLFIGTNDVRISSCSTKSAVSYKTYKSEMEKALSILKKELPRTIVSILAMWNSQFALEAASLIKTGERFACSENKTEELKQRDELVSSYRRAVYEIQQDEKFHSSNFTVVVQGFLGNVTDAFRDRYGHYDASFYADDLFHLSKYGNAVLAKWFWNGLIRPSAGGKMPIEDAPLLCPDEINAMNDAQKLSLFHIFGHFSLFSYAEKCDSNIPSNYLCCNPMLELFMELTLNNPFNQLKWKLTNKDCAAAEIQRAAQQLFNTSFESFVSESEICGKNNFRGDLMCKIRTTDGKAVMMYATPVPYSIDPCCPSKPLS